MSPGSPSVAIDARRREVIGPETIVCGLPLVIRILRGLARADIPAATVWVADREASARLSRLLADHRVPSTLAVAIEVDADAELPATALCGWGIYDRSGFDRAGLEPLSTVLRVESADDKVAARRQLFAWIRKSVALDGVIAYYAKRPLSRQIVKLLMNTPVTANQATLLALVCGLAAAFMAARGDALGFALAGVGYWLSGMLDCVDGDLARIRLESSRLGEWLDSMTDELNTLALLVGMGIGLDAAGADRMWLFLAIGGTGVAVLTLGRQYLELHRLGGVIDTAQFPWFFRDGDDTTKTTATSPIGWVLVGFGYLIRRDANITGISLLLVLDLPKVAVGIIVGAFVAVGLLTAIHFTVTRIRSSPT